MGIGPPMCQRGRQSRARCSPWAAPPHALPAGLPAVPAAPTCLPLRVTTAPCTGPECPSSRHSMSPVSKLYASAVPSPAAAMGQTGRGKCRGAAGSEGHAGGQGAGRQGRSGRQAMRQHLRSSGQHGLEQARHGGRAACRRQPVQEGSRRGASPEVVTILSWEGDMATSDTHALWPCSGRDTGRRAMQGSRAPGVPATCGHANRQALPSRKRPRKQPAVQFRRPARSANERAHAPWGRPRHKGTISSWPRQGCARPPTVSTRRQRPRRTSHTRAVPSSPAVAASLPSADSCSALMRPVWPCSTWRQLPVCRSQTLRGGGRGQEGVWVVRGGVG